MNIREELKDWLPLIDLNILIEIFTKLTPEIDSICPNKENILRAFRLCDLNSCKVILVGQDPYPQKGVATGLAFANKEGGEGLSPSLEVLKEAAIDYTVRHNFPIIFDNILESWAEQGVLMLNSALTTKIGNIGLHTMLWRPFISTFLENVCKYNSGYVFILLGSQAQTFEPYIDKNRNLVLKENHPAFYARTNTRMPSDIFYETNKYLNQQYGSKINWYKELIY